MVSLAHKLALSEWCKGTVVLNCTTNGTKWCRYSSSAQYKLTARVLVPALKCQVMSEGNFKLLFLTNVQLLP